jgi:radical SAM protein with 4Fe4S-binding SPASM domain
VVQADGIVLPCIGMKDTPALQIGDVRRQSLRQVLSKSHGMKFGTISQQFHQCPAILYQQQPDLIQISL